MWSNNHEMVIFRSKSLLRFLTVAKSYPSTLHCKMSSVINTDADESKDLVNQFFDGASAGNVDVVNNILKASVDVNIKNERGWTALMLAARNGHTSVITTLLEKGCVTDALNSTGQTAFDIATFWNHKTAADALQTYAKNETLDQNCRNFFSLNKLFRAADKRKDNAWIEEAKTHPDSRYIAFSDLKPFIVEVPKSTDMKRKWKYRLARFTYNDIKIHLDSNPDIVLLGQESSSFKDLAFKEDHLSNSLNPSAYFAIDVTGVDEAVFTEKGDKISLLPIPMPGAMQLEPAEAGIFSEARSLLAWHDRYKFCPTCGNKTQLTEAGYKRSCIDSGCRSHQGVHNTCYPRVDPSMIILVVSPDNQKCLLGRGHRFPQHMFSCLAGYMEPGESLEDTCRREVEEESGVKVGRVDYHSSQPWPFPAVLMLGCIAYATSTEIKLDKDEMEDARWFTRPEVVQLLTHQHPQGWFLPPDQAIAHQLVKSWVRMTANL